MSHYITTYTGLHSEPPVLHIDMDYTVRPFADVEKEYLDLFHRLFGDHREESGCMK